MTGNYYGSNTLQDCTSTLTYTFDDDEYIHHVNATSHVHPTFGVPVLSSLTFTTNKGVHGPAGEIGDIISTAEGERLLHIRVRYGTAVDGLLFQFFKC